MSKFEKFAFAFAAACGAFDVVVNWSIHGAAAGLTTLGAFGCGVWMMSQRL